MNITYDQYISEYQHLDPGIKTLVRRVGALQCEAYGHEEIGSSDVSCAVFELYKRFGNWSAVILHGLDLIQDLH